MYYFIGIKGSGMAPLAEILHELGNDVCGSDIDKYIFIEAIFVIGNNFYWNRVT